MKGRCASEGHTKQEKTKPARVHVVSLSGDNRRLKGLTFFCSLFLVVVEDACLNQFPFISLIFIAHPPNHHSLVSTFHH